MPAVEQKVWTVADVRRYREEREADGLPRRRVEIVDGELAVSPAPRTRHQRAVQLLNRALDAYVVACGVGEVFGVEVDLVLNEANSYLPDLSVVPFNDGRPIRDWEEMGRLLLVVEVLSPSTARNDRLRKRVRYQGAGIPEYWIVDVDGRVVERWRPDDTRPEVLDERLAWHPEGAVEALEIDLAAFFARAWGE